MKGVMYFVRMLFSLVLLLAPTLALAGTVQLPQTGQTTCYDTSGTVIACAGTGQDGDLRAGVAWPNPRFTDNGDQTVTDNLTGLVWAKDANLMKTRDRGFDTDSTNSVAGDGMVIWQHALDYVKRLNTDNYLGYNDWRLPNVNEIGSLVNTSSATPATWLNSQGFSNVQMRSYWSSTTYNGYYKGVLDLNIGYVGRNLDADGFVWPVRSGLAGPLGLPSIISLPITGQTTCWDQSGNVISCAGTGQDGDVRAGVAWPNPRFKDKGDQTVLDNLTGLIWIKDGKTPGPSSCDPSFPETWQGALDKVKCLNTNNYLGYNDWRLPNVNEIGSLVNTSSATPATWLNSQGFSNVQADRYWSSTNDVHYNNYAFFVCMAPSDISVFKTLKSFSAYVWPVRSGQSGLSYNLVISKSGTGSGTVNSTPSGINCGTTCSTVFDAGQSVAITATPDSRSTFSGWSGACSGTGTTCTVVMNAAESVTATFTVTQSGFNAPLYFPHVATSFPWQTEIAIINTSPNQSVTGTLKALSNEGQLVETKPVTLSARGRRQIIVAAEFTNHTNIGYIIYEADSDAVQGYTKFYQEGFYRAAIPAVKEVNTSDIYIPHIASNAQWWTGVSLVNTTTAPKQLTITFNNGQSVPYILNANEHKAFTIASLFNNQPQPDIQSAVITNASGIIGLELFGSNGGGNQLDGILLTGNTTSTIYYPHVASDNIWWTGIVAYAPPGSEYSIGITSYSADGTLLYSNNFSVAGYNRYIGLVSGLGLPAQTAWFKIGSTRPLTGFELFGTVDGNQLAAYAGGGGTGAKSGVFAKIEKNGWTGIAFVNTEASAASVTLTAYNDTGTAVATQVLPVDGHAKVVNLAEAIFSQDISGATYIAYSSDRNVVGFQLNGTSDGMMLDGLPGLVGTN